MQQRDTTGGERVVGSDNDNSNIPCKTSSELDGARRSTTSNSLSYPRGLPLPRKVAGTLSVETLASLAVDGSQEVSANSSWVSITILPCSVHRLNSPSSPQLVAGSSLIRGRSLRNNSTTNQSHLSQARQYGSECTSQGHDRQRQATEARIRGMRFLPTEEGKQAISKPTFRNGPDNKLATARRLGATAKGRAAATARLTAMIVSTYHKDALGG